MTKRYRSGWWLAIKYHDEDLTQREIAAECAISPRCIRSYMDEYGIETRDVEGEHHGLYGKKRDEDVEEAISASLEGREFSDETNEKRADAQRGRSPSAEVRQKISDALEGTTKSAATRRRMSEATAGEQNPNWRGGYSRRYGAGWSVARETVHERDEVCQRCGADGTDRRLEVHHIVPVRRFRTASNAEISDAHDPGNLVLLCHHCHPKADHGLISFDSSLDDPLD
ncbi:HNH endonuclease [Halorientalis marina]|uniref:HNH endonuclease n=1 Tax=Halorientalis marina TaxID=2931976 RepID=UPI001FF1CB75|nr:HNH endonuclease signature motif containing protein [Halorientalis marina]